MQAELSAALLQGKAALWQLVYQCQGDSLIYWRLEIAASGRNKDRGYSLRHQSMHRMCCVLCGMVLVALCQSKSPAWYMQCWTYLSWEQLWRSAQMAYYIRISNVPISIWAGSVDGYQHFLCGLVLEFYYFPFKKKTKNKSWLQPASWQVQNPAPVCCVLPGYWAACLPSRCLLGHLHCVTCDLHWSGKDHLEKGTQQQCFSEVVSCPCIFNAPHPHVPPDVMQEDVLSTDNGPALQKACRCSSVGCGTWCGWALCPASGRVNLHNWGQSISVCIPSW